MAAGCSGPSSDGKQTDAGGNGTVDADPSSEPVADASRDSSEETGEDVQTDPEESNDRTTFRITSPRSDRPVRYRLKVVESPEKVRDGSRFEAEEDNDNIVQESDNWMIVGETGTAPSSDKVRGDTFRWPAVDDPEYGIAGWSADAPAEDYTIVINGMEVDPGSLPDLEAESSDSPCLGGGSCYADDEKFTAADADITVSATADLEDLQSALQKASDNDVVFIDPGAEINLGFFPDAHSIEVPAEVTLASNRGVNGSDGALLHSDKKPYTDWEGSDTIRMNENSRITGLRIEGPAPDRDPNWLGEDHDYTKGIDATDAAGVVVDNNEVYGWPHRAISGGAPIHVHHNLIRDNHQNGLGYGVGSTQWPSEIEYNRFERNRHSIAGTGHAGEGYIARHNFFGPDDVNHVIDMHEDPDDAGYAGTRMEIYNNTIQMDERQECVYIRATPRTSAEIYDNWFFNTQKPCLTGNGDHCAIQVNAGDWTNVDYRGNHYGTSEPPCDVGAPRESCSMQ